MSAASEQRPRLYALLRRWPTVLGVSVAALTLSDFDDGREFAIVLLIASLGYLAIAVLERPQATWWVLIRLLAGVVCLRLLNIAPGPVLAVAAVGVTIVGLARGSLRRLWLPALQAPATLIFGAVAFIAIAAGSQVGSTLVAVGLLTHTVFGSRSPSSARIRVTLAGRVVRSTGHLDRRGNPRLRVEVSLPRTYLGSSTGAGSLLVVGARSL
jgi:hypothetical protein